MVPWSSALREHTCGRRPRAIRWHGLSGGEDIARAVRRVANPPSEDCTDARWFELAMIKAAKIRSSHHGTAERAGAERRVGPLCRTYRAKRHSVES